MSFQSDNGRCTIATYEAIDQTSVSVNNSEVATKRFGKVERSVLLGQAIQTDTNVPNGLRVSFNFKNKLINFFANLFESTTPNYYVMETDYDSYALGK